MLAWIRSGRTGAENRDHADPGQNSNTGSTRTDDRKEFDDGWLGLLGLAGLRNREAPDRLHTTATSRE